MPKRYARPPPPQIFEMPTGGAAIMRQGPNLLKLARKEQCLALLTQLRTKFKIDGFIYRVFPNGEVQYLHPKVRGRRRGGRGGVQYLHPKVRGRRRGGRGGGGQGAPAARAAQNRQGLVQAHVDKGWLMK